jgi:general secretion pathway protein I
MKAASQRGFTLLEVLIALGIAAVALVSALRAAAAMTDSAEELNLRTLALWSAENRLTQLRVQNLWPEVGSRTSECPQGLTVLICQETVVLIPNQNLRRVDIEVRALAGGRVLAKLTGFSTLN